MKKSVLLVIVVLTGALLISAAGYFFSQQPDYSGEYSQQSTEQGDLGSKPEKTKYETGKPNAADILELVNQERQRLGVQPLISTPELTASAQAKVDDMVEHSYYGHENYDGSQGYEYARRNTGSMCRVVGENINLGQPTSQEAFDSWKRSEDHYKAMVDPQNTHTGIAVGERPDIFSPSVTAYLQVQHFCQAY